MCPWYLQTNFYTYTWACYAVADRHADNNERRRLQRAFCLRLTRRRNDGTMIAVAINNFATTLGSLLICPPPAAFIVVRSLVRSYSRTSTCAKFTS